jgi:hypothetical protein
MSTREKAVTQKPTSESFVSKPVPKVIATNKYLLMCHAYYGPDDKLFAVIPVRQRIRDRSKYTPAGEHRNVRGNP